MGNGESTARRISMQRTDEGTIQITEGVLARLNGQEGKSQERSNIQQQDNLQELVEKAFQKGREVEHERSSSELRTIQEEVKRRELQSAENQQKKLQEVETSWKQQLQEQRSAMQEHTPSLTDDERLEDLALPSNDTTGIVKDLQAERQEWENRAEESKRLVEDLRAEKHVLDEKLQVKEDQLKEDFNRGVLDIERKINPLRKTSICVDSRNFVLECYRANKGKPLNCAKEVQKFVDCVQQARVDQIGRKTNS